MNKKKLILSLYVSAIALSVATLSMSLAWYAAATRLRIDSFTITIDCDRQLAISTKPDKGYVANLNKEDLDEVGVFIPVTSAHRNDWKSEKWDMPVFYDDTNFSPVEQAELTGVASRGYLSQKLYLKADDDVIVSINPEETWIKPNNDPAYIEKLYQDYQTSGDESLRNLTRDDIKERLSRLVNAMRYSILVTDEDDYNFSIIDPNKNDETYFGGLLDNDVDGYYDYYTKNSDGLLYERVYGDIIGDVNNIVYDDALEEDSAYEDVNEEPSAFNARHKKGVKRFNKEQSLLAGVSFKKEETLTLSDFESETKPFIFPVYKDKPQEIVLSIYIEGWDLDSINYTMGATFKSNIAFKIEKEA